MSSPFKTADPATEQAAIERLLSYVDELFQGEMALTLGVGIERVEAIHLGAYRRWRMPTPVKVLDGRDEWTATLFGLVIDKNPLEVVRDPLELEPGERYRVKPYRADLASAYVTHLLHWHQFADIAVDDTGEMARSGMPKAFAEALGSMSTETREVYQTNLRDIHDRPASLRKIKPKRFMKVLATYGTYAAPAGDYFAKWQPGEVGSRDVVSAYTDEMLAHSTSEVYLKQGGDYLLLTTPNGYRLFALAEDEHGLLSAKELIGSYDSFHFGLLETSRRTTAVLFHAANGFNKNIVEGRRRPRPGKGGGERIMLDPRQLVESLLGVDNAQQLSNAGDPWAWFVEMVKGFFPDPFYVIDFAEHSVRPDAGAFGSVRQWGIDAAKKALASAADPNQHLLEVNAQRRKDIEAVLVDPDKLVIPQGTRFGAARFIGADGSWVYLRDVKNGAVFVQTHNDFVWDAYLIEVAQIVYENTAGVIPLVGLVAACAAAPFVVTAIGPAAMARFITEEGAKRAAGELAKRAAMRLVPALAAKMTSLVTSLFVYASGDDDPNGDAQKWRAFADGFFRGYLVNTLYDGFVRGTIGTTLAEGIPEYRYYKMVRRLQHVIERVHTVVQTLERELTKESARAGVEHFKKAMGHTVNGVLLLMSSLYHLEHDQVNPILHLFGQEIEHEPPNPAEWELEAGFQLGELAEQLANELKLHDLDDVLTALRKSRAFPALLAAGMLSPHIWKTIAYTWGARPFSWKKWEVKWIRPARPAIIMVAIASMIGLLMYADDQLDDKLFPTLQELVLGLVRDLPGPTADRAQLNGEVVGNVVGVFMFNSLAFKAANRAPQKKKWKDNNAEEKWTKLTDSPLLGSSIQRNLKIGTVGPILRLLLRRYVTLYEDMRAKGVFLAQHSEETIGAFLDSIDDEKLERENMARLQVFQTDEESVAFSLSRLVRVLFRLRTLLARDLETALSEKARSIIAQQGIVEDVEAFKRLAQVSGMSAAVEKHATLAYKTMAMHLHAAVSQLEEALKHLMTEFTSQKKSWLELLRELGLDIDVGKAQHLFDEEMKRLEVLRAGGP